MNKLFGVVVLCFVLSGVVSGCKFSDWATQENAKTGKTVLEQGMNDIGQGMKDYGQGTVLGLAGTLVLTLGGLITFVRKTIVEKNMNVALIKGVQEYSSLLNIGKDSSANLGLEIKKIIAKKAIGEKVSDKLNTRVAKITGDPKTGV